MAFLCCFGLQWVPNFGDYNDYICLLCFDHWVCVLHTLTQMCLVMPCTCITFAHHMHTWCTHLLTCHVLHITHARYLLLTCLALLTWFWDFVYVLFMPLCLLLWTNLDLIKFVFLFCVFVLVSLLCVCSFQMYRRFSHGKEPVIDLTSSPISKGLDVRPMPPTSRDSRLP